MSGELERIPEKPLAPSGSPFLDAVRAQVAQTWTPEFYKQRVDALLEAEDVKMNKAGDQYTTPNWKARKDGLDKLEKIVMPQLEKEEKQKSNQPIRITINVNGKTQDPVIVDAQTIPDASASEANQPKEAQSETPKESV